MNEDEEVAWMLAHGYLNEVDTSVGRRYQITDKFKEDFPDKGKQWDDLISITVNKLWQRGLIEVEFVDDEVRVALSESVLEYDLKTLSEPERAILTSITEWLVNGNG